MRRNKPWFGPNPITRNPFFPRSWEGCAVMVAFVLGLGLLNLEPDFTRRGIAVLLLIAAFCAVVILTWGDPDSPGPLRWRETLWNRQTLVWLAVLVVLGAAMAAAGYQQRQCTQCAAPYWKPHPAGAVQRLR